jgi:hypothetical protein
LPLALLGVSSLDWPAGLNPAQALFRKGLDMGKSIEIRLSDAQYAALSAEADAAGVPFFGHCRAKLVANMTAAQPSLIDYRKYYAGPKTVDTVDQPYGRGPTLAGLPSVIAENERKLAKARIREAEMRTHVIPVIPAPADDRIARIEDAVARLTEYLIDRGPPTQQYASSDYSIATPEPQKVTEPIDVDSLVDAQFRDAEANGLTEHIPDADEEVMQHAGVRPLSRRPQRYSANSGPSHLQELLG